MEINTDELIEIIRSLTASKKQEDIERDCFFEEAIMALDGMARSLRMIEAYIQDIYETMEDSSQKELPF